MALSCKHGGRECDGCMSCQPERVQVCCPMCGQVLRSGEHIYRLDNGDVLGCEHCVQRIEWEEALLDD